MVNCLLHLHVVLLHLLHAASLRKLKIQRQLLQQGQCIDELLLICVSQLEEQLSRLQREKNDLQSRMEEDQEDLNELMKKHKAAVAQVCLYLILSDLCRFIL